MKIKTSELSGVALDWAVAQAIGVELKLLKHSTGYCDYYDSLDEDLFDPSADWAIGGPLIEQFRVGIVPANVGIMTPAPDAWFATAFFNGKDGDSCYKGLGGAALVAACRAVVGLKLGDEVDVPEGLV